MVQFSYVQSVRNIIGWLLSLINNYSLDILTIICKKYFSVQYRIRMYTECENFGSICHHLCEYIDISILPPLQSETILRRKKTYAVSNLENNIYRVFVMY